MSSFGTSSGKALLIASANAISDLLIACDRPTAYICLQDRVAASFMGNKQSVIQCIHGVFAKISVNV